MKNKIGSGKILITGAGGFIGGGLFEKIKHYHPIGVVSNTSFQKSLNHLSSEKRDIVPPTTVQGLGGTHSKRNGNDQNFIEADLRDEKRVKEIFDQYKPSTVFHFAGFSSPQKNEGNPQWARDSNLGITKNILNNLSDGAHVIFPSTDKVFDGSHPNPDEEAEVKPLWLYADLKYQCEKIINKKTNKFHIVRLPIVHSLGKLTGANRGSFIDKAIIDLKAGKEVIVFKNVQRCFVKLEELLNLFEIFIHDTNYGTYHVGTQMLSYYDRLCVLCDELGIDWKDKIIPVEGNANPLVQNLNADKLKNTFKVVLT